MPLQRPLLWSLLLGMLCLTVARSGPLASPVQEQFQVLLDGPLSMLRNVHKVDPLVRLPLALGLAQLTTAFWPAAGRRWAGARTISQALVVIVLLVSAQPLWTGELRKPGWDEVPQAWGEAAAYLAAQEGTGSTLVLPGSGFGQQGWGWTIDEPIQGLASTPWAARSQVPLTPGRHHPQPRRHPGADRRRPGLAVPRRPLGARGHRVRARAPRPRPLRQRRTRPGSGGPRRLAKPWPGAGGVVRTNRLR